MLKCTRNAKAVSAGFGELGVRLLACGEGSVCLGVKAVGAALAAVGPGAPCGGARSLGLPGGTVKGTVKGLTVITGCGYPRGVSAC